MTDLQRIATEFRSINSILKTALTLVLPLIITACGGGADTTQNPFTGNNGNANQGPPAANQDVRDFEVHVWNNLKAENRCGLCHGNGGQTPNFADATDVNIAYSHAVPLVKMQDPASSLLVTKVGAGHNCWIGIDTVCADSIENMITNWAGVEITSTARVIQLTAPVIKEPGDSKNYPALATDNVPNSFEQTVYPLLTANCAACHFEEGGSQQQSPFFANPVDVDSAYEAAKTKINVDLPPNSRLVQRLNEGHNCPTDCANDALDMRLAIEAFAGSISPVVIDPALVTSKALTLLDGIIASGGNRHEANAIALWEFKSGTGTTAFDTSGIEPAMNLTFDGNVDWLGAYGVDLNGGKAWSDTQSSKKLHDFIKSSGEYSIEVWNIPANVTQEDANIVSYDAGSTQKNFALTQTLYNYNFHNRVDNGVSDPNGEPALSTPNADEVLQSSLQHVVVTYNPVAGEGRNIYVNGELINVADPVTESTSISSWDDTYAFVLGKSAANSHTWLGKIRMLVIHNRVLTQDQITQNFEIGVGQKYFLLFSISDEIGVADSYIRFEVSQFDSFSYLFQNPTFINLDEDWAPGGFTVQNMRIGINGKEAIAGQSFANMNVTIDSSYSAAEGQNLSAHGAVIELEKGSDSDEFFLTFELLGAQSNPFNDPVPTPPADPLDADPVSDIGVRTFDEINATIAKITGIPTTNAAVNSVFQQYIQQLPTVETIDAFLASHQMAIAQLALTSCSERVDYDSNPSNTPLLFTNVDFTEASGSAFNDVTKRGYVIDPILQAVLSSNLDSQPDAIDISDLLGAATPQTLNSGVSTYSYDSLIIKMNTTSSAARTAQIVKAVCASAVGSAAMLIQ